MLNERIERIGLSSREAERRLKKYGHNILEKKKKISALKIFLSQFNDFIVWVLIIATIISGFIGEKADAITILIIVVMNAILGFIQEFKTEKSLEALKELAAPTAKVIRDNTIKVINAEDLVLDDIVVLESGDRVPADCVVIENSNLMVDESLLTGESIGVEKNTYSKDCNIYMGTIVLTGRGKAQVVQTGMSTEMGKIAGMLQSIQEEKSPLKEKLAFLGKILVIICIAICFIVTLTGIARGQGKYEMFLLGVSLAVAAIPEGLPAIVTVSLALGVSKMLKRNALIRKLPAVETLGCTSIICSDKTGTLTQNKMTVKVLYFENNTYELDGKKEIPENTLLKKAFVYCNDCNFDFKEMNIEKSLFGDPTETALIKAFFNKSSQLKDFLSKSKRVYDKPFNSDRKMMSVIMKEGVKETVYVKGAPEKIIAKCKYILLRGELKEFNDYYKRKVERAVENMSYKALRCIAAAYKPRNITKNNMEENLVFLGVAGIIDPPRREVKDAVLKCKIAGIRPVMITGDHKNTAYAIGKELEICEKQSQVISGEELDNLTDKRLLRIIDDVSIFARVSPKHKLRIVKAFKEKGNVVAMTGDGVNDAPAVKESDIGISMGVSGTDVTKEASSMILLDDNFTTIVSAVEEGRVIYNNIRKFIRYLLSCNLGEVLTMFLASLLYLEPPMLPIQILFVNLATDGLPAIALGVDPASENVMLDKPRYKKESIFARGLKEKILIRGSLIGICTILAFIVGKWWGMNLTTCRTLALSTLIISQLIHVFECKSEKHSLFEINIFTNWYLIGSVFISLILLLLIIYLPFLQKIFHTVALKSSQWFIVIFFSGIITFINSVYLLIRHKKEK